MREILEQGLAELGLDGGCIPALESFAALLLEKNRVMNLTAITEPTAVARLHLLDSLALLAAPGFDGARLVDVGTGAGFPGLPLAIARRDMEVTLLDSLGKRVAFLEEVCQALKLDNVRCVHGRAEEFAAARRESYDLAVSRAVAALPMLCELCLPLVAVGGAFWAMKSTDSGGELSAAGRAIRTLGGAPAQTQDYTVPTGDVVHRLVRIGKISPTPAKYPRRFAQIKKQPL